MFESARARTRAAFFTSLLTLLATFLRGSPVPALCSMTTLELVAFFF